MSVSTIFMPPQNDARPDSEDLPHILLVVDQFPKSLGGGERIVLKLASLLPTFGFRASILTFLVHPESAAVTSASCPIYLLPLQRTYDLSALRAAFSLKKFIKEQNVRVVNTFFESSDIWAGFATKMLSKAKLVWSRRDMGILRTGKHRVAYRLMASMPDAVFAVSELVRQHSIDVDHIAPERVQTIYNGLDLDDWKITEKNTSPSSALRIATIGNIRRVKGHDVFIKAAAMVAAHSPEARFCIAGEVLEESYFLELQTMVHDLKLSDRFEFSGGVTNLQEYLADAEIFVLPSRSEGFSNAIIEAMAAGLPVVATDVGGNAEAVQDGISGFIVPPEDATALAKAMIDLLSNPAQARTMGLKGRERVAEQFTTDAMMRKIASAYRGLLSDNR